MVAYDVRVDFMASYWTAVATSTIRNNIALAHS